VHIYTYIYIYVYIKNILEPTQFKCINRGKKGNFLMGAIKTPWVLLDKKQIRLPSLLDSGSSLSFTREDVFLRIKKLGLAHVVEATERRCVTANGKACRVIQAVTMSVKLQEFSWKVRFLVFEHCPVPCVLGVDFLLSLSCEWISRPSDTASPFGLRRNLISNP
jgi:hypothetical protein